MITRERFNQHVAASIKREDEAWTRWHGAGRIPLGDDKRGHWPGVYFVRWHGYVKIGCAENIVTRLRTLVCAIPCGDLVPLGWMWIRHPRHPAVVEEEIHQRLAAHRVRGEWFDDCPEIRAFIQRHCLPWPESSRRRP